MSKKNRQEQAKKFDRSKEDKSETNNGRSNNIVLFKNEKVWDETPTINCTVNDIHEAAVLLDSGADHSVIRYSSMKRMIKSGVKLRTQKLKKNVIVDGMGGTIQMSTQLYLDLNFDTPSGPIKLCRS